MLAFRLRTRGIVFLIALVGACAMAGPAGATGTTPYSVVVSPGTAAAGTRVEFKVTFTNRDDYEKLGSANLTAPAGFRSSARRCPHRGPRRGRATSCSCATWPFGQASR